MGVKARISFIILTVTTTYQLINIVYIVIFIILHVQDTFQDLKQNKQTNMYNDNDSQLIQKYLWAVVIADIILNLYTVSLVLTAAVVGVAFVNAWTIY